MLWLKLTSDYLSLNSYHIFNAQFRKGFASLCYANDVPLKVTQQLMGHGDQTMTLYYIQIEEQTVRDRLENLHNTLSI